MNRHSKIFIAGHKGMVGSAIKRHLESAGYESIVTASRQHLDLQDKDSVQTFFKVERPEYVFLAAAKVGGIGANAREPVEFLVSNLEIQTNVLECSRKWGVRRVLVLGSSCIYPRECVQPMKEQYLLTGPLEPTNEGYALSKIVALKLAEYYAREYGFECVSIMPPNLYGPNDNFDLASAHVLAALVRRFVDAADNRASEVTLWGTGSARREFLHVDDAAAASVFFLQKGEPGRFYNVGWGDDISIKDLAARVAARAGYTGIIHWDTTKPDGMPRKCMDVSVMKQFGFQPSIVLDEGVSRMVREYQTFKGATST